MVVLCVALKDGLRDGYEQKIFAAILEAFENFLITEMKSKIVTNAMLESNAFELVEGTLSIEFVKERAESILSFRN